MDSSSMGFRKERLQRFLFKGFLRMTKLKLRTESAYEGFLAIKKAIFHPISMLSRKSPPSQTMEYMERGDSVSVLVKRGDEFVILKQFRIGNFIREGEASVYSNVAGMVDKGETPKEAALRELSEELGVVPSLIEELGIYYPSAGGSTERMTFFFAEIPSSAYPNPKDREIHSWELVSEKEYRTMIVENKITSMQMVTAFLLAEEKWYF